MPPRTSPDEPAVVADLRVTVGGGWSLQEVTGLDDRGVWVAKEHTDVRFPADAHASLSGIEDASPWFRARNRMILSVLDRVGRPAALWEVGAGNGTVSRHLAQHGMQVVAIEPGPQGAAATAAAGLIAIQGTLEDLRLPSSTLPAVGMFDVLEHLADPTGVLREVHRVLAPGGLLVLTVPAHPLLWSQADELAGHTVRYTRGSLRRLLLSTGFTDVHVAYRFATLAPLLWLRRALPWRLGRRYDRATLAERGNREVRGGSALLRTIMRVVLRIEHEMARRIDLPFGSSLVAVFRR